MVVLIVDGWLDELDNRFVWLNCRLLQFDCRFLQFSNRLDLLDGRSDRTYSVLGPFHGRSDWLDGQSGK